MRMKGYEARGLNKVPEGQAGPGISTHPPPMGVKTSPSRKRAAHSRCHFSLPPPFPSLPSSFFSKKAELELSLHSLLLWSRGNGNES